ncbi:unnamed protein product [Pleuronectes platessa]|uniref:Uncharacterized protein n=1 Tax=Pleuronectes platessa TaxID=8262 RepID=A0A9N7YG58_PLEPL|nr:unnamed protein product [Pleuronectes platessa]
MSTDPLRTLLASPSDSSSQDSVAATWLRAIRQPEGCRCGTRSGPHSKDCDWLMNCLRAAATDMREERTQVGLGKPGHQPITLPVGPDRTSKPRGQMLPSTAPSHRLLSAALLMSSSALWNSLSQPLHYTGLLLQQSLKQDEVGLDFRKTTHRDFEDLKKNSPLYHHISRGRREKGLPRGFLRKLSFVRVGRGGRTGGIWGRVLGSESLAEERGRKKDSRCCCGQSAWRLELSGPRLRRQPLVSSPPANFPVYPSSTTPPPHPCRYLNPISR